MSRALYLLLGTLAMAIPTYLVRMLPFVAFRKKIKSKFLRGVMYYMPYSVLSAMTIPWVFYSTGSYITAAAGFVVAVVLSVKRCSLVVVALSACAVAFLVGLLPMV